MPNLKLLDEKIIACRACPRLVEWREQVAREKRKSFQEWEYWGRAVPNFGDEDGQFLIVGLAPAAHGANRTGRMFTGDRSGDWLYRALYKAGVANQPESTDAEDGLKLINVLITAVNHCAPPDNKPTREEMANCAEFLFETLKSRPWKSVLCLGGIAWEHVHRHLGLSIPKFGHGIISGSNPKIVGCYHPSQQNTFTGRLTERMLDSAVSEWLS